MLGFKQFVAERKDDHIEQGFIDADGLPNVVITKTRQGDMVNGVPNVVILKKRKANIQEREDRAWESVNDNHHIGNSTKEVHTKMAALDKTKPEDHEHLKNYTSDSEDLNKTLFKDHKFGRKSEDKVLGHDTKSLDKAVSRTKLPHDLHVYSGVGFHPGHIAAKHPDGHVHLAAYTSTSIDKNTAKEFAEADDEGDAHILHIHLKKGQSGAYLHSDRHSEHPHEHEFLLPRKTTIKIHPKPDVHVDNKYGVKTHIWHAEVVK